ncbi:hypothetical protein GCM10020221_20670 [Streptomyces thioluteus]|uniref:Uncharacterized protein n=1 Tax=Streptomyces thioluteus TaxID=66431 RepID=A0ABN3WQE6_STRTU
MSVPTDAATGAALAAAGPAGARLDLALLLVAVSGIALSAPLIASMTAAPALAIAFWRKRHGGGRAHPLVLLRHRAELRAVGRRAALLAVASGALLAVHFGVWLPSLSMTSVASSTALVTTTPIWTVVLMRLGRAAASRVWSGRAPPSPSSAW